MIEKEGFFRLLSQDTSHRKLATEKKEHSTGIQAEQFKG